MGDIAIRVDGLGKQYRIGARQKGYRTFREVLTETITTPIRRVGGLLRGNASAASDLSETIWALKDVSFEVKRGEVVGIIGRNGAGKSTLLKILSRITEPSEGEARVYGRVGALLEVGTGFHPELTGRENIYLNGAILGMSRAEINRKFDEIVAFAEVERFIDTPVKHYSSGMGLRLGFAVAAHLEPEILIVDEVLAVGDAAFQKKCLGKMGEVAGEGRTVLFVSHNMAAVAQLCRTAIHIDRGQLHAYGQVAQIIKLYLGADSPKYHEDLTYHPGRTVKSRSCLRSVHLVSESLETGVFQTLGSFGFVAEFECDPEETPNPILGFAIRDSVGNKLFATNSAQYLTTSFLSREACGRVVVSVDALPLSPGSYFLDLVFASAHHNIDTVEGATTFEVVWNPSAGPLRPPLPTWGSVFMPSHWRFEPPSGQ